MELETVMTLLTVKEGSVQDRRKLLECLSKENVVPVKAPPWADYPFELRRNEKTKEWK